MSDLPPGWTLAALATIADVQLGRQRSPKNHFGPYMRPYLRAANVTWNGLSLDDVKEMNFSPSEMVTFRLVPGDILLSEASGSASEVGKPAIWGGEINDCCFQNTLLRVRTDSVDPRFLLWFFKWLALSGQFATGSRGVGIHHLGAKALSEWNVPVAPLSEQKRIIAAVEEQFSQLDVGVAALERAQLNLKRLRDLLPMLLLAKARSTARYAAVDADPAVDGQYRWASLAEVSQQVVDCAHSTPKYVSKGMPCIDTTCISAGIIHRDRLRYVDPATHQIRVRRLAPQHGDLIFAREGTVGTAVVVPEDLQPCLGQRVMLFRPDPSSVDSDYMCLVVNSEIVKRQYRSMLLGTTVPHLNVRDAKALHIPLPALRVQRAIAAEADQIGSVLSVVESAVEANTTRSSALRSSILNAAFTGKLVSQDPDDENASVLVERITSKRAASNGHRSVKNRKSRTPRGKVRA
jgi:type I restriction enzyme S subunit